MKTKRKILVQIANPAGNVTAYVLNGARREEYAGIAKYIMEQTDYGVEQVGFVKGSDAFDMSGMEFCGNAARAFALMSAKGMIDGKPSEENNTTVYVTVSDGENPIECEVDLEKSYTRISMPLPKRIKTLSHCDFKPAEGHQVIVMDGIVHMVLENVEYTEDNFEQIKEAVLTQFDPEAMGVMYVDAEALTLTPVVYVKAVDSTYVEGSCGSGTAATAAHFAMGKDDGKYQFDIKQPAGSILATAVVSDGELSRLYIEGPVEISDPVFIEAEFETDENEREEMAQSW